VVKGYWVPVVMKGEGHIGCPCPHDEILMYPWTQTDIDRINQPHTSSTSGPAPVSKPKLAPASISPRRGLVIESDD
jgi:hypothetical protein